MKHDDRYGWRVRALVRAMTPDRRRETARPVRCMYSSVRKRYRRFRELRNVPKWNRRLSRLCAGNRQRRTRRWVHGSRAKQCDGRRWITFGDALRLRSSEHSRERSLRHIFQRDLNDAVFRNGSFSGKTQGKDSVAIFRFFHAQIGEDFSRRSISRSLPVIGIEMFPCVLDVLTDNAGKKSVLDALRLNAAAEHQVGHARFPPLHNGEPDDAVTAETVFAAEYKRVQVRIG